MVLTSLMTKRATFAHVTHTTNNQMLILSWIERNYHRRRLHLQGPYFISEGTPFTAFGIGRSLVPVRSQPPTDANIPSSSSRQWQSTTAITTNDATSKERYETIISASASERPETTEDGCLSSLVMSDYDWFPNVEKGSTSNDTWNYNFTVSILSDDPLIYLVPNLLTEKECYQYIDYVQSNNRTIKMNRSNPPAVSLDKSKLWPLPFLATLSGLPPYLKLMQQTNNVQLTQQVQYHQSQPFDSDMMLSIVQTIAPNILITFILMTILGYGIVLPILRVISAQSARTSVAIALNNNDETEIEFIRPLVNRATAAASILQHRSRNTSRNRNRNKNTTNVNFDDSSTCHDVPSFCNDYYIPITNWEAPVVTRYDPGAVFARHNDASLNAAKEWIDSGGQRVVTCICYLNTLTAQSNCDDNTNTITKGSNYGGSNSSGSGSGGGETYFDQLDIRVKPQAGSGLFFFPANRTSWIVDDRTTHESLPPHGQNVKWIVQLFGRALPVPSPLGLPPLFFHNHDN